MFTTPVTLLDGLLEYYPAAIEQADLWQHQLRETVPWQQDTITIYGRQQRIPRLQSWHGDDDALYQYSGTYLIPKPWTTELLALKAMLPPFGLSRCNSVLCNLYRSGQDSMGWHSDDEPELDTQSPIVSISLGCERDFAVRRRGETRMHSKLRLQHGSVLVMQPAFQQYWQHSLPKRATVHGERINLTFRAVCNRVVSA
ncbi:alpha-ketoglutarate-dependent dioxygenase AlkB family protein [Bacterioplanes sanyensis]|uniref:alpha-ketoglutarate-dependent dioxygenase AlkB family protein n=1 Tax=Bacterioplanes sanyensis TaxID=1249553 RepID=UPI001E3602C2|nr:alpha-ketoglutarate-dependent dioxygenase AlkB [Bacterioplanes sanyensis]